MQLHNWRWVRKLLLKTNLKVISIYIYLLYKSTQQFVEVKEKFLQLESALEKMNSDNKALLEEKFPTLDAPATLESLFPLRSNFHLHPKQEEILDWGHVEELNIRQ